MDTSFHKQNNTNPEKDVFFIHSLYTDGNHCIVINENNQLFDVHLICLNGY